MQDPLQRLEAIYRCLNTPDGQILMEELEGMYDDDEVFDPDPLVMAQNATRRDVYKVLALMRDGADLDDE